MMNYVCGFVFNMNRDVVLLIKKNKPDWQRNRTNGIGGKIEDGETAMEAMNRETTEETGKKFNWQKTIVLNGAGFRVHFFRAFTDDLTLFDLVGHIVEGEGVLKLQDVDTKNPSNLPNLKWLIPLHACRNTFDEGHIIT